LILKSVTKVLSSQVAKSVCPQCMTLLKTFDNIIAERIAIARALIRNPKILLLDEVCSITIYGCKYLSSLFCRRLLHSTRARNRWCKMLWIMQQRVEQQLPLHTDCQPFKMQTTCEIEYFYVMFSKSDNLNNCAAILLRMV
jgi:hypothetical protein